MPTKELRPGGAAVTEFPWGVAPASPAGQLHTMDIGEGGNRFAHYAHIEGAAATFVQFAKERRA